MNVPNYEVGRLAALTVRMVMASGLSREEARAALGLACAMMDGDPGREENAPRVPMRAVDKPSHTAARMPRR